MCRIFSFGFWTSVISISRSSGLCFPLSWLFGFGTFCSWQFGFGTLCSRFGICGWGFFFYETQKGSISIIIINIKIESQVHSQEYLPSPFYQFADDVSAFEWACIPSVLELVFVEHLSMEPEGSAPSSWLWIEVYS